jgi:hypothetical protein
VQVERKTVAQVDTRGSASSQGFAEAKARYNPSVPRFAQAAGHTKDFARAGSATKESFPSRDAAAHHDIAVDLFGVRQVATGECGTSPPGHGHEATIETPNPLLTEIVGKGKRDQTQFRLASHRGDIAQVPRQRTLTNNSGWLIAPEMDILDHRIYLKEKIVAASRPVDGAVITDPERYARAVPGQSA